MTYIRASDIGCALDCDLKSGHNKFTGGSATDDAPRINAALSGATEGHPITLIIDGSALISGLFLPANGHWSIAGLGCGTGFFIKKGTNNDGIHNGAANAAIPSDPGPPAPPRGSSVSLSNFTLNGNRGDGSSGDSTSGERQGITDTVWYFGINLMNLDHINVEKLVIVNPPAYHIRFSNVGDVAVSGCVMNSFGPGWNTDGLHFDGSANDITIADCDFTMGDDAIALNCPEGYTGNISRVAVTNCTFNSFSLMRLYTMLYGPNSRIDTVNVSNCRGTLAEAGFSVGYVTNSSTPDSVASLTVKDCTLTAPAVLEVGQNFGDIVLDNVTLIPTKSDLGNGLLRPSKYYKGATFGASLTINNCSIKRQRDLSVAAVILDNNSTIHTLTFNGLKVDDSYSTLPELIHIISGSVGQLALDSVDGTRIKAPVSVGHFSDVSSVTGMGVLATQWEFPDSIVADGIPYLSLPSGRSSIKIGGVVEAYP